MDEFEVVLRDLGEPIKVYEYPYKLFAENSRWGVEYLKTFKNEDEAPERLFEALYSGVPNGHLPTFMGFDDANNLEYFDILHQNTLVAGETGSGKTTWLYSLLMGLFHFSHPEYVKAVILDPKQAGFISFDKVANVLTSHEEIKEGLNILNEELLRRMAFCKEKRIVDVMKSNEIAYKTRNKAYLMPYIVVLFDEFADFIIRCNELKEPEFVGIINRLASMGRGLGIRLIFSTQAPYAEYIKGNIKNNFQRRIAFALGGVSQENIILESRYSDADPRPADLITGQFILRKKGRRKVYKGVYTSYKCVETAVKNWSSGGFNWSFF